MGTVHTWQLCGTKPPTLAISYQQSVVNKLKTRRSSTKRIAESAVSSISKKIADSTVTKRIRSSLSRSKMPVDAQELPVAQSAVSELPSDVGGGTEDVGGGTEGAAAETSEEMPLQSPEAPVAAGGSEAATTGSPILLRFSANDSGDVKIVLSVMADIDELGPAAVSQNEMERLSC